MKQRIDISNASVPRLPPHVKFRFDQTRQQWLLLAPERVLMPDETAAAVLQLCDGKTCVDAIAETLAQRFAASREVVCQDVTEMLQDLLDKGVIEA